ncbi:MAG TPA: PilN domain-containing protein [Polyangiaceae bacterium]|jgi:general secretion pathway protein L
MAKFLGIDVGGSYVRAVLVHTSYRRIGIEAMRELERPPAMSIEEAVRTVAGPMVLPGESIAINLDGGRTFIRRLTIPLAAQKQLAEVLPFELESELPFELSEGVYDYSLLRRAGPEDPLTVFAVVARTEDVQAQITLVKNAVADEPERVAPGGLSLSSLTLVAPELATSGLVMLLDLEDDRSEVVLLDRGEPVLARTLSRGVAGLPASAPALAREIRQTLAAFRASGGAAPEVGYLLGSGAALPGATEFLGAEVGIRLEPLPPARLFEPTPEHLEQLPRFAKAASLALALTARGRGLNLRKGPLAYERGFGFLRDKVPLLSGLAVVILFSFFFSTWAELRALAQQKVVLEAALSTLTKDVFGESTDDPARATDLLDRSTGSIEEDPLPHADAFDVMVELSQAVPDGMVHDIEELDVQRSHVTVHGIAPTIPDAQQIAATLKNVRCFQDVKIVRTTQEVGGDRQKYNMEFDVKCPNEGTKDKATAAGAASGAASAGAPGAKP